MAAAAGIYTVPSRAGCACSAVMERREVSAAGRGEADAPVLLPAVASAAGSGGRKGQWAAEGLGLWAGAWRRGCGMKREGTDA